MLKILILLVLTLFSPISYGELNISSNNYLVYNIDTQEILLEKNKNKQVSIASITKLMTAVVNIEAGNTKGLVKITTHDIDRIKGTTSRIRVGTIMSKEDAYILMLQSSENRSANAIMRDYPGGYSAGIRAMNRKAMALGMSGSVFVDANGLNPRNKSTPRDLVRLLEYAERIPKIKYYTTHKSHKFKGLYFINSNPIVREGSMDVLLQKTGFINEAGFCVVMDVVIGGNRVAMVFLDSKSKYGRFQDVKKVATYLKPPMITASIKSQ